MKTDTSSSFAVTDQVRHYTIIRLELSLRNATFDGVSVDYSDPFIDRWNRIVAEHYDIPRGMLCWVINKIIALL